MAKTVSSKPEWLKVPQVVDLYSVSGCLSEDFADYIEYWKHNGYWLFDSPEIIRGVAHENSIPLERTSLFYYEVYGMEFDGNDWCPFQLQNHQSPRTWFHLQKRHSKASMWSRSSLGMRQNVRHFRAMEWRRKFALTNTVYSALSMRLRRKLRLEPLTELSRDPTVYSLSILLIGRPLVVTAVKSP
jgi:hypothetical protein